MMMNLPCLKGSCPNFLRPIYHTLSASQAPKRGHAPRKKPMPATALVLCLIVTDLHSPVVVLIYSVDAIPSQVLVGLLQMQSVPDSIIYGFLFQNPVQSPIHSISHSTEFWIWFFYLLCCHWCLWSRRSFDIFQQFLRIISSPCLQDCVNHPQYLAGYHNQWLHLFQRIVGSCCIVLM